MLTIRAEQVSVFERQAHIQLAERLEVHLRNSHPESVENIPDIELRDRIVAALDRAAASGLRYDVNLAAFVILTFVLSPAFDQYPPFAEELCDPDVTPDEAFEDLLLETPDDEWEEARWYLCGKDAEISGGRDARFRRPAP